MTLTATHGDVKKTKMDVKPVRLHVKTVRLGVKPSRIDGKTLRVDGKKARVRVKTVRRYVRQAHVDARIDPSVQPYLAREFPAGKIGCGYGRPDLKQKLGLTARRLPHPLRARHPEPLRDLEPPLRLQKLPERQDLHPGNLARPVRLRPPRPLCGGPIATTFG